MTDHDMATVEILTTKTGLPENGAVLVVDDEGPLRSLLAAALTKGGFHVETAAGGKAALDAATVEKVAAGAFDLVLLDMVMPPPDGLQTLRRLRERFGPSELPVVMLTGIGESVAVVRALEAGANDYITKPFDIAVILARVRTQVTLRRQAAALKAVGERMRRDLEAAAAVQQAALPAADLTFGPYRFARLYQPCDQLSGDGLNVFPVSETDVGFYVLDATGHGVRAALLSAAAGRLLLPAAGEGGIVNEAVGLLGRNVTSLLTPAMAAVRPSRVAARLDRLYRTHPAPGQLFTLLYGLLAVDSGEILYTAAGHPGPIHLPASGPPRRLPGGGLLIGAAEDDSPPVYEDRLIRLAPGDRLVFQTDGLLEARSPSGELFGETRLLAAFADTEAADLPALLAAVADACRRWTRDAPPEDDRTLLAVERQTG